MGLFSKLFKKNTSVEVTSENSSTSNPECLKLFELKKYMDMLLSENQYIPKSGYRNRLLEDKKTIEYFAVLDNSGMLKSFCDSNKIDVSAVETTLNRYRNFEAKVDSHNEEYIHRAMKSEKTYLDNILHDVDPKIKLDDDQRRVILTDEDYCLVIAGAGAGKTTTVAAKVKYLVEKKDIDPSQILVVSFTNKAVQELSDDQLETYKKAIQDKIRLHQQHGTTLIYTFSQYSDRRSLTEHLQEELENHGFVLTPRSNKEVMEKLVSSEENRYIRKLVNLICRFIGNFKTNGYTADEFNRMYHSTQNVRTRLFLDICQDCFLEYERYLKENNAVDFEDMINESARLLREVKEMKQKLNFKYIIVDEYQDISRQRFDLVTALSDVTDAKIIAVGDDWQSIYAFSGSDITLFTKFEEKMGYAKLLKIVKTYRNSQEVIDIAGNFIQKNDAQISKELKSPKNITDPVIIYTYDATRKKANDNNKSGANYAIAHAVEVALEQIIEYNKEEGKPEDSSILLLGRFGFDGDKLEKSGLFEYIDRGNKIKSVKYPKLNITFMTAHASKGLGYDNVIVVNGRNETYGFPSKIEDDPVLSFVIKGDRSIDYAEERRLFYVAMTRTKNRVFFIAPEQNPSEFLLEIKKDYKNVVLRGNWNEEAPENNYAKKTCPICGYPLQYRYKNAYGLRLYICTNEPEICGFMTNEYKAGKLSIMKCDQCRDGYLIVKPGKENQYFLGCTNYNKNGTGCGRYITPSYYYEMFKLSPDPAPAKTFPKAKDILPNNTEHSKPQTKITKHEYTESNNIKKANIKSVFYAEKDLNDVLHTVLQCLSHISDKKYYGVSVLVDVLRGSQSKKIMDAGLNRITEYASLKEIDRESLVAIIEWAIDNHLILQTKGMYPVLHPTYEGLHYNETITANKLKKLLDYLQKN